MAAPLLIWGALALGALALPRRSRPSSAGASTGATAGSWSLEHDGIKLSSSAVAFLNRLAARVSFPIVVTSGIRSPAAQAQAMWDKFLSGEDLHALYAKANGDLVDEILAAPSVPDAAAVISAQLARGRVISVHLTGDAIDIRIAGLTAAQQAEQEAAAIALGAEKPKHESNHLHLEHLSHA